MLFAIDNHTVHRFFNKFGHAFAHAATDVGHHAAVYGRQRLLQKGFANLVPGFVALKQQQKMLFCFDFTKFPKNLHSSKKIRKKTLNLVLKFVGYKNLQRLSK